MKMVGKYLHVFLRKSVRQCETLLDLFFRSSPYLSPRFGFGASGDSGMDEHAKNADTG